MGAKRKKPKISHILVPIFHGMACEPMVDLAIHLSDNQTTLLMGIVPVQSGESMSQAASLARAMRTQLHSLSTKSEVQVLPKTIVSYNPEYELEATVAEIQPDLCLLPWITERPSSQNQVWKALSYCPSDLAVFRGQLPVGKAKLLVVLRTGQDSELALRLALNLARAKDYRLTTLRPSSMDEADLDNLDMPGLDQVLEHLPQIQDTVLLADDPIRAVLEQAAGYDLIIIGACASEMDAERPLDKLTETILESAASPVLLCRACRPPIAEPLPDQMGIQAISILVDKWFAENTFHADEFEDLQRLVDLKEEQRLTISLALPALNEEETVGKVIRTVQRALVEDVPLLDEIVLIDSDSIDQTREIAKSLGVPVFIHQNILPQYGAREGKGEALWKSLYVTHGDLMLWIDTDIVNIHPRFVYGILGPLLLRPKLSLVKGFYTRPIKRGKKLRASGGGRVTELTARPLLNLFYPALSGLIQPLSGEYGGRRAMLEQVPFSSGYGVEIGLLIDFLEQFGLDAIGQVNMVRRIHHNQPLSVLSKMSFAIIQTVIRKLHHRFGREMLLDVNRTMKLIKADGGRFSLEVEEIAERQRPPMVTLPEYRQRFRIDKPGDHLTT